MEIEREFEKQKGLIKETKYCKNGRDAIWEISLFDKCWIGISYGKS